MGDHVDLLAGFAFKSNDYVDVGEGVRLLRGDNISQRYLRWSGAKWWPASRSSEVRPYELKLGDVVLAMDRPWIDAGLKVAVLRQDDLPSLLVQRVARLRATDGLDQEFLPYILFSRQFSDYVQNVQTGTAVPHISGTQIREFPFALPPVSEQRHIAVALGALDSLIENNEHLVDLLDEAFITSWLDAAAQCTETTAIDAHVKVTKGTSYKGAFLVEEGLPMVNLGSFGLDGSYKTSGLKYYVEQIVKDHQKLARGDLVVANTDLTQTRDILGRPVIVPHERATSTHHTFQVRVAEGEAARYWIFAALRQEAVRRRLISYATGTTVAALPLDALLTQQIPWTSMGAIESWWSRSRPFLDAQRELLAECENARQTLNQLLPLLLSGRVAVTEVAA